jgi:hypothetical protein
VRYGTARGCRTAQHGGDTSNQKKVVTVRPVRILVVAVALLAVAGAGWLLAGNGYRGGYGDNQPAASPTVTQAPQAAPQAAPLDPAPQDPANAPETTQPAPRPRIFGFGSEPVYPQEGGFWQLPVGPGLAILITDAEHATKVEFLLTPTGTGTAGNARSLGVDRDGRDGYTARWQYSNQPLLAHLTVRATGPGGTAEEVVGIYHPDPTEQP